MMRLIWQQEKGFMVQKGKRLIAEAVWGNNCIKRQSFSILQLEYPRHRQRRRLRFNLGWGSKKGTCMNFCLKFHGAHDHMVDELSARGFKSTVTQRRMKQGNGFFFQVLWNLTLMSNKHTSWSFAGQVSRGHRSHLFVVVNSPWPLG